MHFGTYNEITDKYMGISMGKNILYIDYYVDKPTSADDNEKSEKCILNVNESHQKVEGEELHPQIEPVIEADKWKQIYKSYPNVHIFPHTQAVLIKPKDIIILHRDYHGLAANSFLLHAYYNYRQLLLFRDNEDERYFLGVPGVYYERERQLAALYGFVEFENGESQLENGNRRDVYTGCFGYYKKWVEI